MLHESLHLPFVVGKWLRPWLTTFWHVNRILHCNNNNNENFLTVEITHFVFGTRMLFLQSASFPFSKVNFYNLASLLFMSLSLSMLFFFSLFVLCVKAVYFYTCGETWSKYSKIQCYTNVQKSWAIPCVFIVCFQGDRLAVFLCGLEQQFSGLSECLAEFFFGQWVLFPLIFDLVPDCF